MPQLTQYGTREISWKPVTTSSSVRSTCPNCEGGCATVTVAAAPVSRWRASRPAKSTSTSSSPLSANTSPFSRREAAANRFPPPRGRGEPDPAAAAEPLRLAGVGDLDAEAVKGRLELLLLSRGATDDH